MFKKAFLQIALAAVAFCHGRAQQPEVPDLANARVTIPYSELKDLWKAAQQKDQPVAKPPVAATLLSARYEVEWRGNQASGFIEFEAQSFADEWTLLPLIGADLQVHKIEPPTANVILRDGSYALLTNHAAKQQIRIHFTAPIAQEGDRTRVQLPGVAALVGLLNVRGVPAEASLQVANATPISTDKGNASFRVAPQKNLELRLTQRTTAVPVPSQWQLSAQCLVRFADDLLRYHAHVTATASSGSALALKLKLPAGARVLSVEGEDLAAWRPDETTPDSRHIALEWRTPDHPQRQFEVVYELPQTLEGEWKLRAPEVVGGTTLPPIFAVSAEAAVGLTTPNQAEAPQPPRWLAERIATLANAVVTRNDTIAAKLLPVVEVAPAIVEEAAFSTRIVSDGSLITEQTYQVRTHAALSWTVQLPDKSELLSCAIDGQRTNPIDRGNGTLELPIPPGTDGKPARISLAYTSRAAAFQPVCGRVKVELPRTPLLINVVEWDLAIPAEYEVAALEGNVAAAPGAKPREGSTVVHLKKELCRNERPAVDLFYQKPEVKK
jgi:hypothetical protein